jgi:hypothetical protein
MKINAYNVSVVLQQTMLESTKTQRVQRVIQLSDQSEICPLQFHATGNKLFKRNTYHKLN